MFLLSTFIRLKTGCARVKQLFFQKKNRFLTTFDLDNYLKRQDYWKTEFTKNVRTYS